MRFASMITLPQVMYTVWNLLSYNTNTFVWMCRPSCLRRQAHSGLYRVILCYVFENNNIHPYRYFKSIRNSYFWSVILIRDPFFQRHTYINFEYKNNILSRKDLFYLFIKLRLYAVIWSIRASVKYKDNLYIALVNKYSHKTLDGIFSLDGWIRVIIPET